MSAQDARLGDSEMAGKMFERSYKPNELPHKPILPPGWTKLVIKGVGPQKKTYVITDDK